MQAPRALMNTLSQVSWVVLCSGQGRRPLRGSRSLRAGGGQVGVDSTVPPGERRRLVAEPPAPAGPGSCSSPRWCSCRSSASTTSCSWPRRTPRSQGRSGKSRCTTRCSSTPSRCAGLANAWGGGLGGGRGGELGWGSRCSLWALTPCTSVRRDFLSPSYTVSAMAR